MDNEEIIQLTKKYIDGNCNEEEIILLENWYLQWRPDILAVEVRELIQAKAEVMSRLPVDFNRAPVNRKAVVKKVWPRIAIAAAAVAAIVCGVWFFSAPPAGILNLFQNSSVMLSLSKHNIKPGKQGATLTLANGKKIRLTDAANGKLAKEAGVSITKTADGQIVYDIQASISGHPANTSRQPELNPEFSSGSGSQYNTLSTAKGETYKVRLSDGSLVWLNAASVLKYPSNFMNKSKRTVELSGEAYFEVAKDKAHPFVVKTDQQQVEVLGTHFNINAYREDASTKTTLLEGSVRVSPLRGNAGIPDRARHDVVLKPNQQAELKGTGLTVSNIEGEYSVAWKNGFFVFNDECLETAMIRIARWYNVQVVYEDEEAKGGNYFGKISKYENISKVLHMLSKTDLVRFKIEGNTVRISKRK